MNLSFPKQREILSVRFILEDYMIVLPMNGILIVLVSEISTEGDNSPRVPGAHSLQPGAPTHSASPEKANLCERTAQHKVSYSSYKRGLSLHRGVDYKCTSRSWSLRNPMDGLIVLYLSLALGSLSMLYLGTATARG